jgi:predicted nucleic acid-binding protein
MTSEARYLIDTSAIVRLSQAEVTGVLEPLLDAGQVATCGVIDLRLYSLLRDPAALAEIRGYGAAAFRWLATSDDDLVRALQIQALLTERGYSAPWPELIVAAVAERHGVSLLHCNPAFDRIAAVTGQQARWVGAERS